MSPSKSSSTTHSSKLPTAKITALSRLKSFGSSLKPTAKPSPILFPPPSWELTEDLLNPYANKSAPALSESNFEEAVPIVEAPEPLTLAQRIKALIEALTIPGVSSPSTDTDKTVVENVEANPAAPIPEGMDDSLVRLLSSEDVMNGSQSNQLDEGPSRPGIWNVLSGLKTGHGSTSDSSTIGSSSVEEDVDTGVMMYAPLHPKSDSQVELATSETVLEHADKPDGQPGAAPIDSTPPQGKGKQVWVPSTTQLSLLTTWWGYRIYLPPPIMEQLDKSSLKATARAAMITSALKWMLDKIPLMLIPAQFRPAVKMLKQLAPVVSYVGVFIAWSWDRIRSYDKGNGVVLTATWLLPVALLPMTWDAGDIHGPRLPKNPEEMERPGAAEIREPPAQAAAAEPVNEPCPPPKEEKKKYFFRW
ncbi:hypothetical protein CVT24_005301 [Panaeolus cyanescens]|uniref:Uncharacterized protein n=1 Tax=Panaeolus cyanescens TaxID=181874 RepID=A0A409Y9C9_9AGAR|nr:hypothetical protein CVT24_005301 [Panaeolus cyanescens]